MTHSPRACDVCFKPPAVLKASPHFQSRPHPSNRCAAAHHPEDWNLPIDTHPPPRDLTLPTCLTTLCTGLGIIHIRPIGTDHCAKTSPATPHNLESTPQTRQHLMLNSSSMPRVAKVSPNSKTRYNATKVHPGAPVSLLGSLTEKR